MVKIPHLKIALQGVNFQTRSFYSDEKKDRTDCAIYKNIYKIRQIPHLAIVTGFFHP